MVSPAVRARARYRGLVRRVDETTRKRPARLTIRLLPNERARSERVLIARRLEAVASNRDAIIPRAINFETKSRTADGFILEGRRERYDKRPN